MSNVTELLPYTQGERCLHSNAALWRYVPLRTLLFHLDGLVFLPSLAKLADGDPFEGRFLPEIHCYNEATRRAFADRRSEIEQWVQDNLCSQLERDQIVRNEDHGDYAAKMCQDRLFEFIRKTRYAWCWFESPGESAAMWARYGTEGVAIRSSPVRIRGLLERSERDFLYRRMRYAEVHSRWARHLNPEDPSDVKLLLRPYFLKRSEYHSEREVRFVTASPEVGRRKGLVLRNCDPTSWIEEVRLWPGLSQTETNVLRKLVRRVLADVPCERSDLMHADTSPFDDSMEELPNLAFRQWLDQEDRIPPELKVL